MIIYQSGNRRQSKKRWRNCYWEHLRQAMATTVFRQRIEVVGFFDAAAELVCARILRRVEPFGEKVFQTVTRIMFGRYLKAERKKAQKALAAAKPKRIKPPRALVIKTKTAKAQKQAVKKSHRAVRKPREYAVVSGNFVRFWEDVLSKVTPAPGTPTSWDFRIHLGQYIGGGVLGSKFVGGYYDDGIDVTITARVYGYASHRRVRYKVQRCAASIGSCDTWNGSQIRRIKRLPLAIKKLLAEALGAGSHLVANMDTRPIAQVA